MLLNSLLVLTLFNFIFHKYTNEVFRVENVFYVSSNMRLIDRHSKYYILHAPSAALDVDLNISICI